MMEITKETSHWWWFDSHQSSMRSPWLQSTLGGLEQKTKAMLKLIEEDADSFAQRAEMYYKKRPELISMVEDFYRTYRSLAVQYDQVKPDSGNRLLTTLGSPFSKHQHEKLTGVKNHAYDSYDPEDGAESEVDDPEQEDEMQVDNKEIEVKNPEQEDEMQVDDKEIEVENPEQEKETVSVINSGWNEKVVKLREEIERLKEENRIKRDPLFQEGVEKTSLVSNAVCNEEVMKLQEEIERLKEENRIQREQLLQKDEEKREVIRQLSLAMEVLRLENVKLRKCIARDSSKKRNHFEFEKLKVAFLGKLFNSPPRSRSSIIAI